MIKNSVILAVLVGALAFVYFHKDSGHDQAIQRERVEAEMRYRHSIDSARKAFDEMVIHKDSSAYQAFKTAQESANRWESIARQSQSELKHEINKHRTFSDQQTDSLLMSVR